MDALSRRPWQFLNSYSRQGRWVWVVIHLNLLQAHYGTEEIFPRNGGTQTDGQVWLMPKWQSLPRALMWSTTWGLILLHFLRRPCWLCQHSRLLNKVRSVILSIKSCLHSCKSLRVDMCTCTDCSYPLTCEIYRWELVPYDFDLSVLHSISIIYVHLWCMLGDSV